MLRINPNSLSVQFENEVTQSTELSIKETFSLKNNLPEGTAEERAEKLKEENKDVEFVQKYKMLKKKYKGDKKDNYSM